MTKQERRERVVRDLECCVDEYGYCTRCYLGKFDGICRDQLMRASLELLKAQEPMLVVNIHKAYNNVLNPDVPWVWKCPKCGKKVSSKNLTRFCMYCGQAVKWE